MIFYDNYGNLRGVLTADVGVDDRHLFATGMNVEQVSPKGKKEIGMARVVREAIKLIADPEKNFVVIMKDGKIYRNILQ